MSPTLGLPPYNKSGFRTILDSVKTHFIVFFKIFLVVLVDLLYVLIHATVIVRNIYQVYVHMNVFVQGGRSRVRNTTLTNL